MSLYAARAAEVYGAKIILERGDVIYAIGNREFHPGDLVWTDGKYAYGFQGRGGGFLPPEEAMTGVPLFVAYAESWPYTYKRAAWMKDALQYGYEVPYAEQYRLLYWGALSNNEAKVWFLTGSTPALNSDSYTADNGLTVVFSSANFSRTYGSYASQDSKVTIAGDTTVTRDIYTDEADPSSDHDTTTTKTGSKKTGTNHKLTWQTAGREPNIRDDITVYDQQGNIVGTCRVTMTPTELNELAANELAKCLQGMDDKQIARASVFFAEARIENGKIYYRQNVTINFVGFVRTVYYSGSYHHTVRNETHLTGEIWHGPWGDAIRDTKRVTEHTESYEIADSMVYVVDRQFTAAVTINSYIEADFNLENGQISHKTETLIAKDYDGFGETEEAKSQFPNEKITYIKYSYARYERDVEAMYWPDDPVASKSETATFALYPGRSTEYTTISSPDGKETYIDDADAIKYILQDDLYADGHGKIYRGKSGAVLLSTDLQNIRAALQINAEKNEWLVVGKPDGIYEDKFYLYHVQNGQATNLGQVYNNKLHKFKNIKKFLAGKASP